MLELKECGEDKTNMILIDIDIEYEKFKAYFKDDWLELMKYVSQEYDIDFKLITMAKSKSGNTHISILLSNCISFDRLLKAKFLLGDDRKRISLGLWRNEVLNNPVDWFKGFKGNSEVLYKE